MLGHSPQRQKADADPAVLIPWLKEVILRPEDAAASEIQVRLRGNILHVLCQSVKGPLDRDFTLMRLVRSLMEPAVKARFEDDFPQIYQVYIYSRKALDSKPVWSAPIYLNRLEKHLERLVPSTAQNTAQNTDEAQAIISESQLDSQFDSQSESQLESLPEVHTIPKAIHLSVDEALASKLPAVQPADLKAVDLSSADLSSADLNAAALKPDGLPDSPKSAGSMLAGTTASVEQLSDISLARQGDSAAIARYLSEALSALNVGVQVSARVVPGKARRAKAVVAVHTPAGEIAQAPPSESAESSMQLAETALSTDKTLDQGSDPATAQSLSEHPNSEMVSRLWVFCEASYSPDPLLIAEPIAERLRQLHLRQFQDAVITIQVTGEAASDWRLRVDLTPPEDMLREWGRWGDVPAISRLVNQISRRYGLKLVIEFKKATLHLISYDIRDVIRPSDSATPLGRASKTTIDGLVDDISALLNSIAPQGIHRAMIYGPSTDDISPEWLRGIDLPATHLPALASSAAALAQKGDLSALAYCLTRSLNPDIKEQLATGGIRVQLLRKDELLHVMADGPVCPPKNAIVPLINQTLEQAKASERVEGIRLYGRRAGQKQPIWTHGQDYQLRQRMVPEAKPEFAASEAYIGELITPMTDASLAVGTTADVAEADLNILTVLTRGMQQGLIKSQVFVPVDETSGLRSHLPKAFQTKGGRMAFLWGAVGVFLAAQFDFMIAQALPKSTTPTVATVTQTDSRAGSRARPRADAGDGRAVERVKPNGFNEELADLDWPNGNPSGGGLSDGGLSDGGRDESFVARDGDPSTSENRFSEGDFTTSSIDDDELIYSPQKDFVSTSSLLAGSTLPSFRSQQLDEKLALYQRLVARSGPPDVLVIGSSRALRGVDPAALRQALGASGHDGLSVFNFGVNGATAQVVDLIVRRLIPSDQLPQIVVWADGARAFNSGRVDITFDAIAVSEGYQQLQSIDSPGGINDLALGSLSEQISARTRATDQRLSELLGRVSSGYSNRVKLRSALGQGFGAIAPEFSIGKEATQVGDTPTELPTETSLIDFDGFLALSTRFNPATYYQDHARVSGSYDGDYKAFRLEGKQTEALDNLLGYTARKQVPIVFINTPLTDEYLDSNRTDAEEAFVQYMVERSDRAQNLIFRDMGQLWPQRYDYFSDPSHLNRYGAYQVSSRLAQDPLIAWPEPRPIEEPQQQSK